MLISRHPALLSSMDDGSGVVDLTTACTMEEIYHAVARPGLRLLSIQSYFVVVGEHALKETSTWSPAVWVKNFISCSPPQCKEDFMIDFLAALQAREGRSCTAIHITDCSFPKTAGPDRALALLGCFTTRDFTGAVQAVGKRLRDQGCSASLTLKQGQPPHFHSPVPSTGSSQQILDQVLREVTLDLHRLPGGHPDVHVTPVGRGGDSWEAVRNLTDQCFCAGRNSPDTAHVIYMETQAQVLNFLRQPQTRFNLLSELRWDARVVQEQMLIIRTQQVIEENDAFEREEHIHTSRYQDLVAANAEKAQQLAALRVHVKARGQEAAWAESEASLLKEQIDRARAQVQQQEKYLADRKADIWSKARQQAAKKARKLDIELKRLRRELREEQQRGADSAARVEYCEQAMQELNLSIAETDRQVDEELKLIAQAQRRIEALNAEIVARVHLPRKEEQAKRRQALIDAREQERLKRQSAAQDG